MTYFGCKKSLLLFLLLNSQISNNFQANMNLVIVTVSSRHAADIVGSFVTCIQRVIVIEDILWFPVLHKSS
jgi:hypothetical protein